MKTLLFLLLASVQSFGITVTVDCIWKAPLPSTPPQVISKFVVYERVGTTAVKLGETSNGSTLGFRLNTVTNTPHTYFVTAVNDAGQESAPSNDATYTPPLGSGPGVPVEFRIMVTFAP